MQHELVVMRHAKTEEQTADKPDHQRALTSEGGSDAVEMGEILREQGFHPDLVICSDATRALATAELVLQGARCEPEVFSVHELYHARSADYLTALSSYAGTATRVLLVGHNPTAEDFISDVSGRGMRMRPGMAALFLLKEEAKWNTLRSDELKLRQMLTPSRMVR